MKLYPILLFSVFLTLADISIYAQQLQNLPEFSSTQDKITTTDWLVQPVKDKASIYYSADHKDIILYNGLVKRTFRLAPNVACTDYKNLSNGQQLLRAVKPEAKVTIDGITYNIGGLNGQKENAYLLHDWVDNLFAGENDFQLLRYEVKPIEPFVKWKPSTWGMNKKTAFRENAFFYFSFQKKSS